MSRKCFALRLHLDSYRIGIKDEDGYFKISNIADVDLHLKRLIKMDMVISENKLEKYYFKNFVFGEAMGGYYCE